MGYLTVAPHCSCSRTVVTTCWRFGERGDVMAQGAPRLVVTASDVSNGRLVRLPWDPARYGRKADDVPVVDAVRASMSIPFFYEPVRLCDNGMRQDVCLVDGGMLSNLPIEVFDRRDNRQPPRWPAFGIKLSAKRDVAQGCGYQTRGLLSLTRALLGTMASFHDHLHIDDPSVIARTIFVDTIKVKATDFDLTADSANLLYESGRTAAERFLEAWNFDKYLADWRSREEPY